MKDPAQVSGVDRHAGLIVLDTNCLIDAGNPESHAFQAVQHLLAAADNGRITVAISRHSLHELESKPDHALSLARALRTLPYYPVGSIDELLGTIDDLAGTFDDARLNHDRMEALRHFANAGADLHDCGALVDAVMAGAAIFVTSDKALSAAGPAARIAQHVGIRIMRPQQLSQLLND